MLNPKIDIALLVEIKAILAIVRQNPPVGLYGRILEADCKLDAALTPLLKHEVEVAA